MLRKIVITSLILGLFTGNLCSAAASSGYTKASKPELSLTTQDIAVIEKAIKNDFRRLSKADKNKLKDFLEDYKDAVKHEKQKPVPSKPNLGPKTVNDTD